MIVATATDRNYVEMTGVMLRSMAVNGALPEARVVVFGDRLRRSDERLLHLAGGSKTEIRDVGENRSQISHLKTTLYWPTATYIRLLAPKLLGGERLLYLDCDLVINGELAELESMSLGGCLLAAVPEPSDSASAANHRLDRPAATPYFNAGVLLIDVKAWNEGDITGRTIGWLEQHPEAHAQDQDALNAVIGSDWKQLDRRYNSHCYGKDADAALVRSATIIHFTGRFKPMEAECTHPAHSLYMEHRARTPWASQALISPRRRKLQRLWRKLQRLISKPWRPRSSSPRLTSP